MNDSSQLQRDYEAGYPYSPLSPYLPGSFPGRLDWRSGRSLGLLVPCLASDFLMMPVASFINGPPGVLGASCVLAALGCILAQGSLLAAWLAWGDQPFLRRLITHWIIAALLYLIWVAGLSLAVTSEFWEMSYSVALVVPLVSVAAQLPLWFARHAFGWRLVRETNSAPLGGESPLRIRDLMFATLIVAGSLGLARLVPALVRIGPEFWIVMGIVLLIASVSSAIAMLPAGALLMRMRQFDRGLLFSGAYVVSLVTVQWLVIVILHSRAPGFLGPFAMYVGLSSLMLAFAATLMQAAYIARTLGYRLTWGRRRLDYGPTSRGINIPLGDEAFVANKSSMRS